MLNYCARCRTFFCCRFSHVAAAAIDQVCVLHVREVCAKQLKEVWGFLWWEGKEEGGELGSKYLLPKSVVLFYPAIYFKHLFFDYILMSLPGRGLINKLLRGRGPAKYDINLVIPFLFFHHFSLGKEIQPFALNSYVMIYLCPKSVWINLVCTYMYY